MSEYRSWAEETQYQHNLASECADALGELLPGEWVRCDPHGHHVAIRSGDRYLTVRPQVHGTVYRLEIDADLPEGYRARTYLEPKRTTVAADRPATAIARQVQRRLLTEDYDHAIAEVQAKIEAEQQRRAAVATGIAEIEALIPGAHPYSHDGEGRTRFYGPAQLRGSIHLLSDATTVDFKLDWVPIDLAREIAALLGSRLNEAAAEKQGSCASRS